MKEYRLNKNSCLRLAMLMTHYKQPLDWTDTRLKEAERILNRWGKSSIPCEDLPPVEFIETLCNDLNTWQAITLMHKYKNQDGKKLFACMNYLGLFDGICQPDEIKTIPQGHIKVRIY